jgi:GTP1/Obg family GTP-binding protein
MSQNQINRISRAKNLKQPLIITQDGKEIVLQFPAIDSLHKPEGKILLFFPIDNHLDKEYDIETDDSLYQRISTEGLLHSRCIVKVTWKHDSLDYYVEKEMMIR